MVLRTNASPRCARARRIGARTRGSGIAVAVAVALACALAVAAVREGAAGRSRATARLGGTANERGNFFGAPLSAEARMRAPAKADVINRISLRTRVPGLRSPGRGVPGLRTHVRETQRGERRRADINPHQAVRVGDDVFADSER